MNSVLVVEDNNLFASLVRKKIKSELKFDVKVMATYAETAQALEEGSSDFFVAVLDLVLPDAPMVRLSISCSPRISPALF